MSRKADLGSNFRNYSGGGPPGPQIELLFCLHIRDLFLWDARGGGYIILVVVYMILYPSPKAAHVIVTLV